MLHCARKKVGGKTQMPKSNGFEVPALRKKLAFASNLAIALHVGV